MGDPRKIKRKYSTPSHLWQKARIDDERALITEYGLSNKREIWKASSQLKTFTSQAKRLIAEKTLQSGRESEQLLSRLSSLGLLRSRSLESVLDITIKNILDRRLQSLLVRKSLARTSSQSRQMITHSHVVVGNRKVTSPSYLVRTDEEDKIGFAEKSPFAKAGHPERAV
ncbi:30S ribosomal protein S4 [Candidatus Woesearchaeota archaeon]|nr:30S ribosomal protein S4 [Candidatus Woesearchaeota archaeon]